MLGNQPHLSDQDLLRFSDQELSLRRASRVREHVAQCESCRERLKDLEAAAADLYDIHEQELQALGQTSFNTRNLFKARLSEASIRHGRPLPGTLGNTMIRQLASACLALLLVVGVTWATRQMMRRRSNSEAIRAEAIVLPRKALTPGSTRAVQIAELCRSRDLDNDPPVNPSLEQAVFNEYGLQASSRKDYELDYLITPALGGADNIQNLWPQPYSSAWNARAKDQLEDHLHELVCQGKIQLATAQNDIASDWIAAYKRYFNTDRPEPKTSMSPKHGEPLGAADNLAALTIGLRAERRLIWLTPSRLIRPARPS